MIISGHEEEHLQGVPQEIRDKKNSISEEIRDKIYENLLRHTHEGGSCRHGSREGDHGSGRSGEKTKRGQ